MGCPEIDVRSEEREPQDGTKGQVAQCQDEQDESVTSYLTRVTQVKDELAAVGDIVPGS